MGPGWSGPRVGEPVANSATHASFRIPVGTNRDTEPRKFGTAPALAQENYPGSDSGSEQNVPAPAPGMESRANLGRLRLRFRAKCSSGSGSGSEQNVPAPAAPAPARHPWWRIHKCLDLRAANELRLCTYNVWVNPDGKEAMIGCKNERQPR